MLEITVHPDDLDEVMRHLHLETKIEHGTFDSLDFRIIHRDGHTIWINHACRPVYGNEGQPLGRRACNSDITDRKRAEEELNASRMSFTAIVENSSDGIVVVDEEGEFFTQTRQLLRCSA